VVGKKVTPEQARRIREVYDETKNGYEVARRLGLGHTTVYNHLALKKCTHPIWSDDEIQTMVDGYLEKIPVREIAG
jgi:DNA invertase Pin-like site-specific DNA recombinase